MISGWEYQVDGENKKTNQIKSRLLAIQRDSSLLWRVAQCQWRCMTNPDEAQMSQHFLKISSESELIGPNILMVSGPADTSPACCTSSLFRQVQRAVTLNSTSVFRLARAMGWRQPYALPIPSTGQCQPHQGAAGGWAETQPGHTHASATLCSLILVGREGSQDPASPEGNGGTCEDWCTRSSGTRKHILLISQQQQYTSSDSRSGGGFGGQCGST